jgi:hypothetical protein
MGRQPMCREADDRGVDLVPDMTPTEGTIPVRGGPLPGYLAPHGPRTLPGVVGRSSGRGRFPVLGVGQGFGQRPRTPEGAR